MNMNDGRKIYGITELNQEIKTVLENSYSDIWVQGEIAGLKIYASGHKYFFLKDNDSQISAVIFQGMCRYVKFSLEDGQKVLVRGRVTAYPKSGDYQIVVNFVEPAGLGGLQLAFEQLKEKLRKQGLFDENRKRKIPLLVTKIGIVTSPDGAAIRDILSVINRRFANVEIIIYPVRVQGGEAKDDIARAIKYLNAEFPALDALLVGRGGGSYQDLWAFNEETVAMAIYESKIPVISCVGHETDFTIADFVADLRTPTPSAAAEIVVRNKTDISEKVYMLGKRLTSWINSVICLNEHKLSELASSGGIEKPDGIFEIRHQQLDELRHSLDEAVALKLTDWGSNIRHSIDKLRLLSPLDTLSRGYSISRKSDGRILKNSAQINVGDKVNVMLHKGSFRGHVTEILAPEKEQ